MCIKSDTHIEVNVDGGVDPVIYKCPMGLIDSAIPIIIEGMHLGNVFIGQLFIEESDEEYFIAQAREYGFDESIYLEAVRKVPLCSEKQLRINLIFISNLVQILAEKGLNSKRQLEVENELRESEKKLNVIFETSEAGIIVISPLGIITFANRRSAEMFDIPLKELIGTHYIDYVHSSEKESGTECMIQIMSGEKSSVELVRHYIRKNGSDLWANLTGTRFENVDGSMRDQVVVISDITPRMRAEEEKKQLELQLQQAQKLESLGVLAGGIAHDFNNIMTIIMGGCYLIKMDPETAKLHISTIEKAAERAASLCQQMLTYAGKAPSLHTLLNLKDLVYDMVDLIKTSIPNNTAIHYSFAPDLPDIKGDSSQLSQIILNLVINAAESITDDEEGEIHVSLITTELTDICKETNYLGITIPSGYYICLEVTDNGSGMDNVTKLRIFEPFYTTKFAGRGLGMSAVLGIIQCHCGALQIFSQPGEGSTFKVYLPAQASKPSIGRSFLPKIESSWKGRGTIFLVEDDEQIIYVAKFMLEKLGFTVITASNGKEALNLYPKYSEEIILVITDIGMPIMDGYQLFRSLKAINPGLPIIIASGFGNAIVTAQIPEKEIAGFINKPYDFDKFKVVLENVLGEIGG